MTNAALHVARTGLDAQNTKMRVIANNLANVNTTGFKKDRADFETLAYQQIVAAGANSDSQNKFATGLNLGSGVSLQGTSKINTQGTLQETGNALDMAIEGSGYFQVQQADGSTAYTRAGNFSVTAEGTVVTSDGLPLIPQITVPQGATSVTVGNDGTVSAIGGNLLVETAASGTPQVGTAGLEGRGLIRSGNLETSNVNIVEELVDMIETQRAYEVNSKMIKATDEMLQYANQNM
jgi:flagellar basal-body rod protein FlgG